MASVNLADSKGNGNGTNVSQSNVSNSDLQVSKIATASLSSLSLSEKSDSWMDEARKRSDALLASFRKASSSSVNKSAEQSGSSTVARTDNNSGKKNEYHHWLINELLDKEADELKECCKSYKLESIIEIVNQARKQFPNDSKLLSLSYNLLLIPTEASKLASHKLYHRSSTEM